MSQLHNESDVPMRNLWPIPMATLSPIRLPEHAPMPGCIDELEAWAYIGNINDHTPFLGKQLFYNNPVTERVPVTVLLYGMIRCINVTPLGTWKGKDEGIIEACRMVELDDPTGSSAFTNQCLALDNLRKYIGHVVRAHTAEQNTTCIRLQQRLFTKVDPRTPAPVSTLHVGQDPEGLARRIQDRWVVTCNIDLKKRTPAGQFRAATALTFEVGDFVETEVCVDVVVRRSKGAGPKVVDTRLRLVGVTKLLGKADPTHPVNQVNNATGTPMDAN